MAKQKQQSSQQQSNENTNNKIKQQNTLPLKIKLDHLKIFTPLTENQAKFFELYKQGCHFIALLGSAGTGKTFVALYKALEEVLSKDNPFEQVVIIRSLVQLRDIGYLPGDIEEKQEIFELPYKEICSILFGRPDAYTRLKEQGHIRFLSTTAIRGITIDDAIILVDEMQNMNFAEINTIMGRIGNRSKIIFCGDYKQSDLIKSSKDISAFHDFRKIATSIDSYREIYFTQDDIVRSNLTRDWIIACEKNGY